MSESITIEPNFRSWRERARALVAAGVSPDDVFWSDASTQQDELFSQPSSQSARVGEPKGEEAAIRVSPSFLSLAEAVACHSDPERWALLYRILWRLTRGGEEHLLVVSTDSDIRRASAWAKEVGRDVHKMRAFVRFRKVGDSSSGREHFVAWFEPMHHIVRRNAPFFRKRFTEMEWSILTPDECAHWDGAKLQFTEGVSKSEAPDEDALEELWKGYYRSIFNPARLKLKAMQSEMPVKYWKNLPEATLIEELTQSASQQRDEMIDRPGLKPRRAPRNLYLESLEEQNATALVREAPSPEDPKSLSEMRTLADCCRACPLWDRATRTVFGEGNEQADFMIIGEQPGDEEDLAGRPFVGPAGQLLKKVLDGLGIERKSLYLTNAVKHFKWKPSPRGVNHRGTTRLHDKASRAEITACRPWLWGEIARVNPKVVLTLGNTAGQSLAGADFRILQDRGEVERPHDLHFSGRVFATVHPSYLLRIRGRKQSEAEQLRFREEILAAYEAATSSNPSL